MGSLRLASAALAAATPWLVTCGKAPTAAKPVTVFAAASTAEVVEEAARRFEAARGVPVVVSFDASSTLARQILAGAAADVFLSADEAWMDEVEAAGRLQAGSRQDLLANELVLVAPANARFDARIAPDFDVVASLPEVTRIAAADPSHVPAGRYARQALEALGWWQTVEPLLVPASNVRAALRLVELGEADAGIVYATDARGSDAVAIVAAFPEALHEPIRYPVAVVGDSDAGSEFVEFLRSPEMANRFEAAGFHVTPGSSSKAQGPSRWSGLPPGHRLARRSHPLRRTRAVIAGSIRNASVTPAGPHARLRERRAGRCQRDGVLHSHGGLPRA